MSCGMGATPLLMPPTSSDSQRECRQLPRMPVIGRKTLQRNLASLEKCSGDDNFFKWCTQLKLTCTKEECKEISVVLTWLHGHLHQDDTHKREVIEPFALAFGFT